MLGLGLIAKDVLMPCICTVQAIFYNEQPVVSSTLPDASGQVSSEPPVYINDRVEVSLVVSEVCGQALSYIACWTENRGDANHAHSPNHSSGTQPSNPYSLTLPTHLTYPPPPPTLATAIAPSS
eukprot:260238-Hanusia_phi.AAC.1